MPKGGFLSPIWDGEENNHQWGGSDGPVRVNGRGEMGEPDQVMGDRKGLKP